MNNGGAYRRHRSSDHGSDGAGDASRSHCGVCRCSFLAFLYRESSTSSPILDLSLFRIRMFSLSSLSLLLVGVAQVMIGFVLPFYLQDILHLSPSFMGLLFISAPVFTVTLFPVVGLGYGQSRPAASFDRWAYLFLA